MNFSPVKYWIPRPGVWIGLLGLSFWPGAARAEEKIPALVSIPQNLQGDDRRRFAEQREALQQQFAAFQAAAKAFNVKTADEQTDAEFNAVQGLRKNYLEAAKLYNQTVVAAAPETDARVVDARQVPSGLDPATEKWLASFSTAPGVTDRLRKGWLAFKNNDLQVASAWFEDALNHDPNNPSLGFLVDRCHGQQKLISSPAFNAALTRDLAISRPTGDPADEHAALRQIWAAKGPVVLPEKGDMEFLFPDLIQDGQIQNGSALPVKDEQLNHALQEHPELRPQLLAAWKTACAEREQGEAASMATALKQLMATAAKLGLPAGHFEEALAKDPRLQAQWQTAIEKAGSEEFFGEVDAALSATGRFDAAVQSLRASAAPAHNSAHPYELK